MCDGDLSNFTCGCPSVSSLSIVLAEHWSYYILMFLFEVKCGPPGQTYLIAGHSD